jgi:hypothetical protein
VLAEEQSLHRPDEPHAPLTVPGAHVAPLQQPPLHGCVPPQAVPHLPVIVLHALPGGQSAALRHPHAPLARQAEPFALPVQSRHTLPAAPHILPPVPGWQVPFELDVQQPEVHGTVDEHEFTHMPPVHELAPIAQSVSVPQPHWPPLPTGSHLWPFWLPAQFTHTPPLLPQN